MEGWAPLIGPQRYDSEGTRAVGYDYLDPTLGQSLGAAAASTFTDLGGTGAVARSSEMNVALGTAPDIFGDTLYPPRQPVTEQQWKESADYRQGLTYFQGMTSEAAKLLAERHDTRARRDDILNRTTGVGRNSLVVATQLATGIADPLGLVASLVPVVGEARYARLLAQLGRPGARAVTGLAEGAVGQAFIEPFVYAAAQKDQLDYSMVDSLISVGEGAAGGALLRVGGGAIADLFRGRGEVRTAAADTAIRQAAAGAEIDVRPVLEAAPKPPERIITQTSDEPMPSDRPFEVGGRYQVYTVREGGRDLVSAHIGVEGDTATVGAIGSADPNVDTVKGMFGHKSLRELAAAVKRDNPEVQWISGARVTGARHGTAAQGESPRISIDKLIGRAKPVVDPLLERDRETIRRGLEEDARKPKPIAQMRKEAHEDLMAAYPSREVKLPSGKSVTRKGPIDLATFLRTAGGIQDAPELRDLERKPRSVEFAKGEGFIGALVSKDGMSLERAAEKAAAAGYIGRAEMGAEGVTTHGTVEELVDALHQTVAAGDDIAGRVWGVGDEEQPLHDYIATMRGLDQQEAFSGPIDEHWQPLTDEDFAAEEGAFGDVEDMTDPEVLWQEEMARAGLDEAPAKPRAEGEPAPLTPEQKIEADTETYKQGVQAAASCMARVV